MWGAVWLWLRWVYDLAPAWLDSDWTAAIGGFVLAAAVYGLVSWLFRSEELMVLVDMVRRRRARGATAAAPADQP